MNQSEARIRDAEGLARLIEEMAVQVCEGRRRDAPLRLIGVRTRGFPIALRLADALRLLVGDISPVGALDITLYRDDLDKGERWPVLRGTDIPFWIEGADIVLVDDVLYTGRTIRAALNAVCDLGRPARIRLAALVDRGHRELPIQPDVVGLRVETSRDEQVRVRLKPMDALDEIVRLKLSGP
jgi:pyrimidine operon attenuation protein / uracil phosphoribosyltransferase